MADPGQSGLAIRLADDSFADYVLASDYSFEVTVYVAAQLEQSVECWPVYRVKPYRKCYGIDPLEFSGRAGCAHSDIFMAWLDGRAVGHVVVSTHWNGYAYVDELAVDARARRSGVARALLGVVSLWARKKALPGIMLETQNNNLGACLLYESQGFVLGGIDHLRYRAIDPETAEVALFWYQLFPRG
jgi:ribosomal protein S18 acetylase RimI-like enzyme